jgi:thiamine-phosphate pyrophosphorylase
MILMLVTDGRRACPEARTDRALVLGMRRWLAEAIDAGVDQIQVREPDLAGGPMRALVGGLTQDAAGTTTQVLVNSRADVARVAGAHGVHLKDTGWPAFRVRSLWAADDTVVLGRSVHGPSPEEPGVDYLLFGAVFGSGDKPERGTGLLATVTATAGCPVLAVGGIVPSRVGACRAAGAAGVAAITAFLPAGRAVGALGPRIAIGEFRSADTVTTRTHE